MAFFKSGNPTLSEKIFSKNTDVALNDNVMTVRGAMNKFGFLLLMVLAGASYMWTMYYDRLAMQELPTAFMPLFYTGLLGGLVLSLVITFKPKWSGFLSPVFGLLEGLFVGGLSAIVNEQMEGMGYANIVLQAVGLTFGIGISMFLLYNFRIIRLTKKVQSIIIAASFGVFIFYIIRLILSMGFNIYIPFMQFGDNSWLGIGISIFLVALAAINLILDFELIEKGAEAGAPKYMEWFGGFALTVTIVWLYIEILRLLSRFASRD